MTELSAERNYAVANKQQAAEAAAALEAEAAALLDQKKQAVTALQSQISQLKVCSRHYNISALRDRTRFSVRKFPALLCLGGVP